MLRARSAILCLFVSVLAWLPALAEAQLGLMSEERRCAAPMRSRPQVLGGVDGLRFVTPPLALGALVADDEGQEESEARRGITSTDGATAPRASLAAVTAPVTAQPDEDDGAGRASRPRVPHIPEPMVFDLVRGLGARQWELEANTLFMMPVDPDNLELEWAPEIELALADGFAVELELPMRNANVEALKFAAQLTFGTALDGHFIHGTQAIVEYELEHEAVQTTLLYLAGIELDSTWSLLGMAGLRTTAGPEPFGIEVLINGNLFAQVADILVLGLEVNYSSDLQADQRLLVMPQAHITIGDHLRWQLGAGLSAAGENRSAVVSSRVILEL